MAQGMTENFAQTVSASEVTDALRQDLAHGDAFIGTIAPILRHLLANDEHSVFGDDIIARTRGMLTHIARQILDEVAAASGNDVERTHEPELVQMLTDGLVAQTSVLTHLHATALEWRLTERMQARLSLDPVISPLLQALIASPETSIASSAMTLLAAQARFAQYQRRMELPLAELPGDLLHGTLMGLRTLAEEGSIPADHASAAERQIKARYDEGRTRLGQIARLIMGLGGGASAALSIGHAGVGIFLSALALASGQDRDMAALASSEGQLARFALALRAAGLRPQAVEEQFFSIHPEISLPDGFEKLGSDQAAALLAHSVIYPGS